MEIHKPTKTLDATRNFELKTKHNSAFRTNCLLIKSYVMSEGNTVPSVSTVFSIHLKL